MGIDPNQVIRTDPRAGTNDFESNCFASVEFDRPDLPWLLTPARANSAKQLRPWLCLVVLRKQQGVSLDNTPGAALPVLRITPPARADLELPSLADCWAWAHAQVAADDSTAALVNTALTGPPDQTLSRLICPRILAPETDYIACVVPTFEVGRKAGLGQAVTDDDLKTLAPAWALKPPTPPDVLPDVLLPVYFHWEFRTGEGGNFESLATGLTSGVPTGLGARPIDISHPGFSAAGAKTANLEGALKPVGAATGAPPDTPLPAAFVTTLAGIINAPSTAGSVKLGGDPVLAPPIYGRWHAAKPTVDPAGTTWLDQINLDPRWRATAAFGTRVVQTHQEALMASAWEQAAAVRSANQRLRQMQMSLTVGEVLLARHFAKFSDETMVRVAAPAFGRLRLPTGQTMVAQQARSPLPAAANGASMRRIARARGPLSRRVAAQGAPRSANPTLVARMMASTLPPAPQAPAGPDFNILSMPASDFSGSWWGAFFVSPETAPAPRPIGQPAGACAPRGHARVLPRRGGETSGAHLRRAADDGRCRPAALRRRQGPGAAAAQAPARADVAGQRRGRHGRQRAGADRAWDPFDGPRARDGLAAFPQPDVRTPARSVPGPAAAGSRDGQSGDRARPADQSAVRRGLHGRAEP